MFLEKHHRFVRHYQFAFTPRKPSAPPLPLIAPEGQFSIFDALKNAADSNKALDVRPNGDIIELMSIDIHKKTGAVVALLHRASPNAADPMYRRKAREGVKLRKVKREEGEEPSVSAHLIILPDPIKENVYNAILEEIPGMSMSLVKPVLAKPLRDYNYLYEDKRKREDSTHIILKPQGVKSESVTNALKTGNFGYIILSRPAEAAFIDAEDVFEPVDEKMKIKVKGRIDPDTWMGMIGGLARRARDAGWDDFQIDIELDDDRMRRVPIARGEEAKEVLFIRSSEINLDTELEVCSNAVVDEFVEKAIQAI
ncbi:hypothetical protein [Sphingomonas elodea]|uniref:hypothetical protein n=1 Tax=Sphingomonas elodea TaxID=179878 RepID=UPI001110A2D2|nr:hypothetical protein [Sphingomonas elodea]